ncbi:MAG TPA: bifunctional DNA-formamidopyrimidine glycosylase/DNA-(apurinic or apyrimidinic site) lyase [Microlunatus sp.]
MPELPEVESVRRGLADGLTGRTIDRVTVLHPRPVRRHLPGADDFAARLVGRTFAEPRRRGKYLWLPFIDGDAMLAHLGMSGQFRFSADDAPYVPNTRVLVDFTDGGLQLRFVDQRMFGGLSLSDDGAELPPEIAHIARDPFDPSYDLDDVVARLRRKRTGVKRALLDQQLVGGVGNIYADEALWRTRMHYARATDTMSRRAAAEVLRAAAEVMAEALRAGGTSFDSLYVNVNGTSGYFDRSLAAYGREGEPCPRCGTPIRREAFMNRSSYRCPRCQRTPSAAQARF